MPIEISAGAVIFRKEDHIQKKTKKKNRDKKSECPVIKYLLLKYNYKSQHWGFVKGNIERGENLQETASREAKEETGLKRLKFIPFKQNIHYFYRRDKKIVFKKVIYLLAEVKSKKVVLSKEHIGYTWADYETALKMLTFREEKKVLRKAEAKINKLNEDQIKIT